MSDEKIVVIAGHLASGFEFYGTFDSEQEALAWANEQDFEYPAKTVVLKPPTKE